MIKIDFEKSDESGLNIYRDALFLPEDHSFTDEEIEAMKQQRFDNWYSIVTAPPIESSTVVTDELIEDIPSDQV
jgi:hypothetical protein